MRTYGKIALSMWRGEQWKQLSDIGPYAFAVCTFLQSCPTSNMMGFYYISLSEISESLGMHLDEVKRVIKQLISINYCSYDYELKYIWIHDMAYHEIGSLSPNDNQVKGVQNQFNRLPRNKMTAAFHKKYKHIFHLKPLEDEQVLLSSNEPSKNSVSQEDECFITSLKPLLSQDQEQDQDQDQRTEEEIYIEPTAQSSKDDELGECESFSCTRPEKKEPEISEPSDIKKLNKSEAVIKIFKYWQEQLEHPASKLDDKRKRCIERALKQGYALEDLCQAIRGCKLSPYHMGDNKSGQVYDELTLILRDASHIESFMHKAAVKIDSSMPNSVCKSDFVDWNAMMAGAI